MTAKLIALAFVLSAAASTCLAAEAPGRYSMTTVEGSVWRLDGATGAMSVCGRKLDHWACESVTDDALALKEEVDRLTRENQELRDKLAKAEEKEAEAAPAPGKEACAAEPVRQISRPRPRRDDRFRQRHDPPLAGDGAGFEAGRAGAGAMSLDRSQRT